MSVELQRGDCLELMGNIPDRSIDMILCDLPYGTTACKWDSVIPFGPLWGHYQRIIKERGAIVLTASNHFTGALIMSNPRWFRYTLVWHKPTPTGHLNANRMPMRAHEDICVFYKRLPTYNPQKTKGHPRKVSTAEHKRDSKKTAVYGDHGLTTYDSTERFPTSVLAFPTDTQKSALHPTQKPVGLMEYLVKTYTNEGETVLDNAMGSGTTGVACKRLGRKFLGIEKDPEHFDTALGRLTS